MSLPMPEGPGRALACAQNHLNRPGSERALERPGQARVFSALLRGRLVPEQLAGGVNGKVPPAPLSQAAGPASGRGEARGPDEKEVLEIEDDQDLRELVELLLSSAGYRVVSARDGREAMELVARHMPSVILLDMRMPRMNGWQFSRAFHDAYRAAAPIVVVTAARDARQSAQEVGAEAFIGKPFNLDEVLEAVEQARRAGLSSGGEPAAPPPASPRHS